ncbi:MAG TPA: host attachment protein, partial [Afifellaceae bacterium]|nr:host attachment protein [Afifellaceae bacterium]
MPTRKLKTWILIADASRARILENDGPGRGVQALANRIYEAEHRKAGDIMADRPGRTFDSAGSGRHAKAYRSDPVREEERAFAASLVGNLQQAHEKGDFDRLILIAPPKMLGDLRAQLPESLQAVIHAEIDKDLTPIPNSDIPQYLGDVLAI